MSVPTKFNPSVSVRKTNIYTEEYFSGADCSVYIDNKQCDISGISYQLQEQLKPIYGYASRTYDDVAVGNRIITGTIRIPLKNDEDVSLTICGKDIKPASNAQEINSGVYTPKVPKNANVFEIRPVPAWIKEWMNEFSYKSTDGAIVSGSAVNVRQTYTNKMVEVQEKLNELGYDIIVTGTDNAKTEKSLLQYQLMNRLDATGTLNEETYNSLFLIDKYGSNPEVVTVESIQLRVGPDVSYPVFYVIPVGATITVLSESGDYYVVRLADGRKGYANKFSVGEVIF